MNSASFNFGELVDARHNRMDLLRVNVGGLWRLRETFPTLIDDLLDVAMAIYVADRLLKRRRIEGSWQPRQLRVVIPVADPERWNTLQSKLCELLTWLTTDQWELEFVRRTTAQRNRPASVVPPKLPERPFVALYSGGLDSLAGAVAQALDPAFDAAVLVGAQSGNRLQSLQAEQHTELAKRLPHLFWEPLQGFKHPFSPAQMGNWNIPEQSQEKSQRSRAFLFMVFGAVTAFAYRSDTLYVYENGIGAINLPYTQSFRGADMTRAMHPLTLLRASVFFTDLFGTPFQIENPSLWRTKGEMCQQVHAAGLSDLIGLTRSCDSFPLREARDQCGLCTSCLLRRLSLHAAGLGGMEHDLPIYRDDIYALPLLDTDNQRLRPYFFMQQQAETMQAVLQGGHDMLPFRLAFDAIEEARTAIETLTSWTTSEVDHRLADLYTRHSAEMQAFHQELTGQSRPGGISNDELAGLQRAQ